jgi:hypothetical protein
MSDDDLSTVSSSSDRLSDGSEYIDDTESLDVCPSPPQESNEAVCVCNLSVKFLLEHGRWVCNANDLSEPVGNCKTFNEGIKKKNYFPFSIGERCVHVRGKGLEFSVDYHDLQCLACGKRMKFNMYQDFLTIKAAKDGYPRPKLVSGQFVLAIRCN